MRFTKLRRCLVLTFRELLHLERIYTHCRRTGYTNTHHTKHLKAFWGVRA